MEEGRRGEEGRGSEKMYSPITITKKGNLLSLNPNGVSEMNSRKSELDSMNSHSGSFLLRRNWDLDSVCPSGRTT